MSDEPDIDARERLEEMVLLCRKRVARAYDKLNAATQEHLSATYALDVAESRLAQWVTDNPDPQGFMFEGISNV